MVDENISIEHGAGGKATMDLIEEIINTESSEKDNELVGLKDLDDGAAFEVGSETIVFTTDSHTIKPIFFPGGDIGKLAIAGTVNDLAVMGGEPLSLSSAVVLNEGMPTEEFKKIIDSMNETVKKVGISISTGDTKVIEKDSLDAPIITTTGIGISKNLITDKGLEPGDKIIVTGNIGEHEASIITQRENMETHEKIKSDVNPIWKTVKPGLETGGIKAMKDPTRGGIAGNLNEIASKSKVGMSIEEERIPISEPVKNLSEMLGIDPLNLTNEGKAIIGVSSEKAEKVLSEIRKTENGKNAEIIGTATDENKGKVVIETGIGGSRLVRVPIGAPTPRIC